MANYYKVQMSKKGDISECIKEDVAHFPGTARYQLDVDTKPLIEGCLSLRGRRDRA